MGREARRVHPDWEHQMSESGRGEDYVPLLEPAKPIAELIADWDAELAQWQRGEHPMQIEEHQLSAVTRTNVEPTRECYEGWYGKRPDAAEYMPYWTDAEATHWQMYEDTTEGTPISPVFATPEELARWLADTDASAFAGQSASYEAWLATIRRGGSLASFAIVQRPDGTHEQVNGVEMALRSTRP